MIKASQKGITMIELVISLAIIGILSVTLLSLFGTGQKIIARDGYKSKCEFKSQEAVENFIKGVPLSVGGNPGIIAQSAVPVDLTVNFEGGTSIIQNIKEVTVTYTYNGEDVTVKTILP